MKKKFTFSIIFQSIVLIGIIASLLYRVYIKHIVYDYMNILLLVVFLFIFISLLCIVFSRKSNKYIETLEKRLGLWNTISYKVKGAGEAAFNGLPIGIIVVDNMHKIMWSNKAAQDMLLNRLQNKSLSDVANGILNERITNNDTSPVTILDHVYDIKYAKEDGIIYLFDITAQEETNIKYLKRSIAIGYINIDNLEESMRDLDVQEKSETQGQILSIIAKWVESFGGFVRAFSDARYILICNYEQLENMRNNNFTILDEIKFVLKSTKAGRITLSAGIACDDISVEEISDVAQTQLENALSRGGDQVIVKVFGKTYYYGAKTDPIIKESKVLLRYRCEELENLMKESDIVFSIGHSFQDADSFASALAMHNLACALGKESYIILDEASIDATVKRIVQKIKVLHPSISKVLITPKEAVEKVSPKSLLMIVDCQSVSQLFMTQKQFDKFTRVGVIDHHRKKDETTNINAMFYFTEPAASSCIELIFSLFEFCSITLSISSFEATWMMLGMIIDTNNFIYRTSSITFDIASTLLRHQADMNQVKEYLKEEMAEKSVRMELIKNAICYQNKTMIAKEAKRTDLEAPTLAKVSDELLTVEGVELGVTIAYSGEGRIRMSARSLGKINCQILMEKFGGGGHLSAAATVIPNAKYTEVLTVEETVERLKDAIDSILVEDEIVKVILIEDVKGKGKKGDIKEFQPGYANYLVSNGHAVIASPENMRTLEQEKLEEKAAAERLVKECIQLKTKIESTPIKISVRVAQDGRILGSVTTKHIADAIEKAINSKVDKRKITFDVNVSVLGAYEATIQLHKDVMATIKIQVIEEIKK